MQFDRACILAVITAFAMACNDEHIPSLVSEPVHEPPCAAPAPLADKPVNIAPGYIVLFKDGVDAVTETQRLAQLYGFTPTSVYAALGGFFVESMEEVQLDAIRCESTVKAVGYNSVFSLTGAAAR
jgi:hypothetical protein